MMVDKSLKMQTDCKELAKNSSAYVMISIDEKGQCSLRADGNVFEVSFMNKVLDNFVSKILNGEIVQSMNSK